MVREPEMARETEMVGKMRGDGDILRILETYVEVNNVPCVIRQRELNLVRLKFSD
jgi:hypothetical protein